jgi:hypothetical protein
MIHINKHLKKTLSMRFGVRSKCGIHTSFSAVHTHLIIGHHSTYNLLHLKNFDIIILNFA